MLPTDHKAPKKDLGQVQNLYGDTGEIIKSKYTLYCFHIHVWETNMI